MIFILVTNVVYHNNWKVIISFWSQCLFIASVHIMFLRKQHIVKSLSTFLGEGMEYGFALTVKTQK